MLSRSCANLLNLVSSGAVGDLPKIGRTRLPRVMTVPGIISDFDGDEDEGRSECGGSDAVSSTVQERRIIVANQLPLQAQRDPESKKWCFEWDKDALVLQLKDGFSPDVEVVYVGCLKAEIDPSEQDEVAQFLLEKYRGKDSLSKWFSPCEKLGISAEHGYFTRWSRDSPWESCLLPTDFNWKNIAEPVMELYTETTDGSSIEHKESALVWHHQEADPDFGSCQAKELLDHLENVLANEPVVVKRGQHIVEVKPQGINKGMVVENLISTMSSRGKPPDFILCIGDDRSDEDMFESIARSISNPSLLSRAEVFACTVGQKPSMAKYYLDDTVEVIKLLQGIATASVLQPKSAYLQVSFEGSL